MRQRSAFFDVDDTLIMWREPRPGDTVVMLKVNGLQGRVVVNKYNLNYLKKLAKRGYDIIIWSKGGSDYCEAVVSALDIEHLIKYCLSKPDFYVDDVKPEDFGRHLGRHVYYFENGKRLEEYEGVVK